MEMYGLVEHEDLREPCEEIRHEAAVERRPTRMARERDEGRRVSRSHAAWNARAGSVHPANPPSRRVEIGDSRMPTTINKPGKRSGIGGTARPPGAEHDPAAAKPEEPRAASPAAAAFVSGAKAIAPVLLALLPFGMAFGASAVGSGISPIEALGMSVFVAAGAAQLAAIPLISADAPAAIVVLTVLIVNLRFALYSASLAPHFRRLPLWWKGLLSYHLTDQAYAATITRFDEGQTEEPDKRWYFLGAGLSIWTTWQAATMLGVFLGARGSEGWSLDFVLPLIFIALALPAVKDRATVAAAISAGGAAVFAAAAPLNLGLIAAALVGVLGGLVAEIVPERGRR
jgi:4-azaleucine resistance transporter AzlC